jgi:hypothetical protein
MRKPRQECKCAPKLNGRVAPMKYQHVCRAHPCSPLPPNSKRSKIRDPEFRVHEVNCVSLYQETKAKEKKREKKKKKREETEENPSVHRA